MNDQRVRWGIAATGGIAAKMCTALAGLGDADVVAVGSRSQESADAFATRFAIENSHGSYDALLAEDRKSTRLNSSHRPIAGGGVGV